MSQVTLSNGITFSDNDLQALKRALDSTSVQPNPAPAPNPVPVPAPAPTPDPGALSRWDAAPSQWAKWYFITPSEQLALVSLRGIDSNAINQHINFYQSYHRLEGTRTSNGGYQYVDYYKWGVIAVFAQDVNGSADSKLASLGGTIAPLG